MGFFQYLQHQYGLHTVRLYKMWAKLSSNIASLTNRRIFLLKCRQYGVLPSHIVNNDQTTPLYIQNQDSRTIQKVSRLYTRLRKQILSLEIKTTIKQLSKLKSDLSNIETEILTLTPTCIFQNFTRKQKVSINRLFHKIKIQNQSKLRDLISLSHSTLRTQSKWFKNLSNCHIPDDIQTFLRLGPKFCIKPTTNQIQIRRILSDVEYIISGFNENSKNICRAQVTNILTNFINKSSQKEYINYLHYKTKKFLKENADLIVLQSDKGNVTCMLEREVYLQKSMEILTDPEAYKELKNDPTSTWQQKANKIISILKSKNKITPELAKSLHIYNAVAPKYYGLPKIHKPILSLRPIIASIDSPNSKIAQFITDSLTSAYNRSNIYYIKDSFDFATFINDFQIPSNYILISLDVVSLFSNISLDMALNSINKNWESVSSHTPLSKRDFLTLVEFVFDSSYCTFNGKFYKQLIGSPMGAIISPIIAQYVMDALLDECIPKLSFHVPFIKKFVDDIVCAVPADETNEILEAVNSFNPLLKFTVEYENNMCLPFLDTKIIRDTTGILSLDWYVKPISSGRYIHYKSEQPLRMKINVIQGLKSRILRISHPNYHNKNLIKLRDVLLENGYPIKLLNNIIFNATQVRIQQPIETDNSQDNINIKYASLPYIEGLTQQLLKVVKDPTIKIATKNHLTVRSVFSKLKSQTPKLEQSNLVYCIPCGDCSMVYVGQTCRNLKSRITSHKSDARLKPQACALAQHQHLLKHSILYDQIEILDTERNLLKRSFLEMFHIHNTENTMNKKTDIEGLSNIYVNLLKKRSNNNLLNEETQNTSDIT